MDRHALHRQPLLLLLFSLPVRTHSTARRHLAPQLTVRTCTYHTFLAPPHPHSPAQNTHPPHPQLQQQYTTPKTHRDNCFDRIFALLPKRLKDPVPDLRPLLIQQRPRRVGRDAVSKGEEEEEEQGEGEGAVAVGGGGQERRVSFGSFGPDVDAASSGGKGSGTQRRRKPLPSLGGIGGAGEKEGATAAVTGAGEQQQQGQQGQGQSKAVLLPLNLPDDAVVGRMTHVTDEELPCGVGRFMAEFWGEASTFYQCVA